MDRFATALTLLLDNSIRGLIGPRAYDTAFGSVKWANLGAMVCFILFALLANGLAAAIVRRNTKLPRPANDHGSWRQHAIAAFSKPLYVLIWAYGFYFAATPLLLTFKATEDMLAIRAFCGVVFDLGVFVILFWLSIRFTRVMDARLTAWATRSGSKQEALFIPLLGKSLRVALPVAGIIFALPILNLPPQYGAVVAKGTSISLIVVLAIILFQIIGVCESATLARFDITIADNLRARKVYTQVRVIRRVVDVIVGFFAVACVLMLFEEVRHVGASLLASAGVVGIIVGIAAQKTIGNLFAGFQIAMAQPIRLDDVVIVEGEWGRIEEITLTYVVVRLWDDRRMVMPLSYFIEKPFQNWTRTSSGLLGAILVWVDYSFPVDEGRKALKKIIENSPSWDKRYWNLQVSDASERTMQLRVLATSADSSTSWNLRCEIREKFIAFIQSHHPQSLPRLRTHLSGAVSATQESHDLAAPVSTLRGSA
jgi:small-conductance mechanosensitive channel